MILTSSATITVSDVSPAVATTSAPVLAAVGYPNGNGRMVHPVLGAFDYSTKPDQWLNVDGDVIVPPVWSHTKTLKGSQSALWQGDISDAVCEERWLSLGGVSMPVDQLRTLISMWTNPVDPSVGYVQWFPTYANGNGYNVIISDITVGSPGNSSMARASGIGLFSIALDDVVNYVNGNGDVEGWVTLPVTMFLKVVSKV